MQCVILAGGRGTRMWPDTVDRPKAMLEVAGRPFIDHQLRLLRSQGIDEVVLCLGFHGDQVEAFVDDGGTWGLRVAYHRDGPDGTLLGTGGAVRSAVTAGLVAESFFLVYGDSYLPIDVRPVRRRFEELGLPALMTVLRNAGRWDTSNARCDGERVALYTKDASHPERASLDWIDYGLSILRSEVVVEGVPAGEPFDLASLFHDLSTRGLLAAYPVQERFYEIGSHQGRADLEAHLTAGTDGASVVRDDPADRLSE